VNPPNSLCIIEKTKSALTSGNGGDESKVSIDWFPTAGNAGTATGLTFAVTDSTNGCLNC
jgi:hypothetical protein